MPVFTTACPRNCYSTCGLLVHVEDGRIRRIEPHPGNRATPHGLCLKGQAYLERITSPDRLLHPLRRRPGSDRFEPIAWDEALDLIAGHLTRLRRDPGPQSILYLTGSGTKGLLNGAGIEFWKMVGGCTTTYGDLCWPAGLEATRLTLGAIKHNAPWDLENARLILLWGKNPAETNIQQMAHLDRALERGARLIVVDPRRTQSAEPAGLLVQPRPGSDAALALGVAHLLVEQNAVDTAFITDHVLGYSEFRERVAAWPPERAARVTGVPVEQIRELAGALAEIRPAAIIPGYGMQRWSNGGQTIRALLSLAVITGNIGRPGAGWLYANLQSSIFGQPDAPVIDAPHETDGAGVRQTVSLARLGRDMLETRDPGLRMVWVERGNPVTQNPDTPTVLKAFRSLEFRVVVEQFMTDTAREADLILPAKSMFEQTDVIGAYWHPYIQIKQKILPPPGEVKPETEIYRELARRLEFDPGLVDERIPGPTDRDIEAWLETRLAPFPGLSLERLRRGPVPAPGAEEVAFADHQFPTPSGKIELLSREAAEKWGVDPLPDFTEPAEWIGPETQGPYPLVLMTPNVKDRIHSQFNNLGTIRRFSPEPVAWISADDATRRMIEDGDTIRIYNDRGELRLPARIDFSLRTGCVVIPNGWWLSEGGGVNLCSAGRETDMGYGAAFHDNRVDVERA